MAKTLDELGAELSAVTDVTNLVLAESQELFERRNALRARIIQTYPFCTINNDGEPSRIAVVRYARSGKGERDDLLYLLDRVNAQLGPVRHRLKGLASEANAIARQIAWERKRLAVKVRAQGGPQQSDLFAKG